MEDYNQLSFSSEGAIPTELTPNKATLYFRERSKRKLMLDDLRLSWVMRTDRSIIWVAIGNRRRFLAIEQLEGPHDLAKLSKGVDFSVLHDDHRNLGLWGGLF